jgi:hypothetical protein
MVVTEEGGNFLFVSDRGAPKFDPDSDEYQSTQELLSSSTSRLFISSFVGDLIHAGMAKGQPKTQ